MNYILSVAWKWLVRQGRLENKDHAVYHPNAKTFMAMFQHSIFQMTKRPAVNYLCLKWLTSPQASVWWEHWMNMPSLSWDIVIRCFDGTGHVSADLILDPKDTIRALEQYNYYRDRGVCKTLLNCVGAMSLLRMCSNDFLCIHYTETPRHLY